MNTIKRYALVFTLTLLAVAAVAAAAWAAPGELPGAAPGNTHPALVGAPTVVAYQGEVQVGGVPYSGDGHFKFAVVNAAGDTTYWSNDGSSTSGGEPTAAVELVVSQGRFSVLLGDTTLTGMTQALTADVFSQPERYLRVWFSDSSSGPYSQLTPDTRVAAVPYALQAQEAANADTLDGLHASQLMTQPQNVVVVAKSGGDYTSVQAAIDSISGESASNPYLVWVAPGVYDEQVAMKPYVHLQGAGQETTVISSTASSAWPPSQATLILASDTSLRDLTVGNNGAGDYNAAILATAGMTRIRAADVTARAVGIGVYNYGIYLTGSGTDARLQKVNALAENGTSSNNGLYKSNGAQATLLGGSFTGRGGTYARGIFNKDSNTTLEAVSVIALAENGGGNNIGLYNFNGAQAKLHGGTFTGTGGVDSRGIYNTDTGTTLEAESVTTLGEDGSTINYGLYNNSGAAAILRGGSFTALGGTDARGIFNTGSNTTLETESVTTLGDNGSYNFGLYNSDSAAASLRGGSFTGRGGTNARGIYNFGSNAKLEAENVSVLAENGSNINDGLVNSHGAASLRGGSFTGRGGTFASGISNGGSNATLEAESVTALGKDGSDDNDGLSNSNGAQARLRGGAFTGRGGSDSTGISNNGNLSTLEVESVNVLGEDGSKAVGLYNYTGATANITQSVLIGATHSIANFDTLTISNSRLVGSMFGTATCVAVSRFGTFLASGCP